MVERYIKEYANACKKAIKSNIQMETDVKNHIIEIINKAIKLRDRGLITADETIKIILERYSR